MWFRQEDQEGGMARVLKSRVHKKAILKKNFESWAQKQQNSVCGEFCKLNCPDSSTNKP